MQDGSYLIVADEVWFDAAQPRAVVSSKAKKIKETPDLIVGKRSTKRISSPDLIIARYFADAQTAIDAAQVVAENAAQERWRNMSKSIPAKDCWKTPPMTMARSHRLD